MQIKEILGAKKSDFSRVSRREREIILARVLGVDRSYLVTHEDEEIEPKVLESVVKITTRRASGEPLAYIFGFREFYGREFLVDPRVLIPRPETETIIDIVKRYGRDSCLHRGAVLTVVDVGTGSGCIGVTVGLEMPDAKVIATDVSVAALALSSENARRFGAENVVFMESDLLSAFADGLSCPGSLVICANLPYVNKEWDWLDKKALGFEPESALYAEDGGLALIKKLILQVMEYDLRASEIRLLLEADPSQHEAIIKFAEDSGLKHQGTEGYILDFKSCLKKRR